MANTKANLPHPGLSKSSDRDADYYTGTKRALIEAGICKPQWFPNKLLPELRKDGRPYRGNNGRPRLRRTYVVEGHPPATSLHHKVDAYGKEFWTVRVEVSANECQRRKREEEQRQLEWRGEQRQLQETQASQDPSAEQPPSQVFDLGDRVVRHAPGLEGHGDPHRIVESYGLKTVAGEDARTVRRYGYIAKDEEGKRWFLPAGELREFVGKPFHLRLVLSEDE